METVFFFAAYGSSGGCVDGRRCGHLCVYLYKKLAAFSSCLRGKREIYT